MTAHPHDCDPIRERFDALSDDVLLTPAHTAEVLAVSPKTLEDWRAKGIRPPAWLKLGDPLARTSPVRYRVGDLRAMMRGGADTLSTAAATSARQEAIDGYDEPALRSGRPRAAQRTVMAFLSSASSSDRWPFVLAEPDNRPLDAVDTMGTDIDGMVAWLTLDDYATAWHTAARRALDREAKEHALSDRATLTAAAGLDPEDVVGRAPRDL